MSNLVEKDGRLARVVESYEFIELAQLEADVASKQETVDQKTEQLNSLREQIELVEGELEEAERALTESKSEHAVGQTLVGEPSDNADGEQTAAEDGTSGEAADSLAQPVPVNVF